MSNWSEKDLSGYYERLKKGKVESATVVRTQGSDVMAVDATPEGGIGPRQKATGNYPRGLTAGRVPAKRGMNKWEAEYAQELEKQKRVNDIVWWEYEPMKLRLAGSTFYTPDFAVLRRIAVVGSYSDLQADIRLEYHEVKGGFWRDDARVKIKVAAEHFPFKFIAVTKISKKYGGGWKVEEFNGAA